MAEILLNGGPNIENRAQFTVKPNESGIFLASFRLGVERYKVTETLGYGEVGFGRINPGSGQVGIYRVNSPRNPESIAVVHDYSNDDYEDTGKKSDWKIYLKDLTADAAELYQKYAMDPDFGIHIVLALNHSSRSNLLRPVYRITE